MAMESEDWLLVDEDFGTFPESIESQAPNADENCAIKPYIRKSGANPTSPSYGQVESPLVSQLTNIWQNSGIWEACTSHFVDIQNQLLDFSKAAAEISQTVANETERMFAELWQSVDSNNNKDVEALRTLICHLETEQVPRFNGVDFDKWFARAEPAFSETGADFVTGVKLYSEPAIAVLIDELSFSGTREEKRATLAAIFKEREEYVRKFAAMVV